MLPTSRERFRLGGIITGGLGAKSPRVAACYRPGGGLHPMILSVYVWGIREAVWCERSLGNNPLLQPAESLCVFVCATYPYMCDRCAIHV